MNLNEIITCPLIVGLFQHSQQDILLLDQTGTIFLGSEHLEKTFGWPLAKLIGKEINTLIAETSREKFLQFYSSKSLESRGEFEGVHKDGHIIPIETEFHPLQIDGKEYLLSFIINLTDKKELESALKDAKKLAAEINARSEVLQIVAHDLRSPLSAIIQSTLLIISGEVGEVNIEQKKLLELGVREANILLSIIDDLLDVATLENQELTINKESTDINAIINNTIEAFALFIKKKGLEFRTETIGHQYFIQIDPKRTIQIINNILTNAIKYTSKGFIQLTLKEHETGAVITITDTGVGFSKENQPSLFKKHTSETGKKPDSHGLGLYIAKHLTELHGGTLEAESEEGKGSKFTITLPTS